MKHYYCYTDIRYYVRHKIPPCRVPFQPDMNVAGLGSKVILSGTWLMKSKEVPIKNFNLFELKDVAKETFD